MKLPRSRRTQPSGNRRVKCLMEFIRKKDIRLDAMAWLKNMSVQKMSQRCDGSYEIVNKDANENMVVLDMSDRENRVNVKRI